MSSYGLQITSANGNSFLIPDKKPFTFHHRWEFNPTASFHTDFRTDIPSHVNALFFCHNQLHDFYEHPLGTFDFYPFRKDGYWWIKYGATMSYGRQTLTVLSFTDVELKNVNGGVSYGLQIFDESGGLIFGNESKPLKIEILPGPPIRWDGFIDRANLPGKYAVLLTGWALETHRGGTFLARCTTATTPNGLTQVSGFLSGIGSNMTPPESWIYYNSSNIMCVRLDDYFN